MVADILYTLIIWACHFEQGTEPLVQEVRPKLHTDSLVGYNITSTTKKKKKNIICLLSHEMNPSPPSGPPS